ncbi:MAG TPA: outer membrane lipoprotein carrier protein LolA, partial [bacterium]|nr:outer membrane lipoprotein carrier protein LolA [bacterium]
MIRAALIWALGLALLPALGSPALAAPCTPAQQALLGQVQTVYQGLASFRAQFEQEDVQPGAKPRTAQGTLAYRKPGHMRWEYAPPNAQLLVTDGSTVWLYDPLLDNVTEQALGQVTQGTPLKFLLGAGSLTSDFTCRAATLTPPSDGLVYLELEPRTDIPPLAFIQLGVKEPGAHLEAFRMVDTQ